MSVLGYLSDTDTAMSREENVNNSLAAMTFYDIDNYVAKSFEYVGPVLMGGGFFSLIMSCVLYCEVTDRYASLVPKKQDAAVKKKDVFNMVMEEFKKSYFRGILYHY